MKLWLLTLPLNIILEVSNMKRIDPSIVMAIVSVESNGNACATRFEPNYRWTLDIKEHARRNYIRYDTEEKQQKTSWGLGQIMGAVARERGFTGQLVELCKPKTGLMYSIDHFLKFFDKYEEDIEKAFAAYNAGSPRYIVGGVFVNQKYVDKIMERYRFFKALK